MASTSHSHFEASERSPSTDDHKIIHLVNFLLQRASNKTPIKLGELMPYVEGNKAEINSCLPQVADILKNTYGILLNDIKDRRSGKRYILTAESTPASELELTLAERSEKTLLWIVLCYIFLRRTPVSDVQLKKFLESCNIDWTEDHHYFGNVKELIEDTFVKDLYLKRVKEGESGFEDLKIMYSWGQRADIEVDKKALLSFANSFMDISPDLYAPQIAKECEIDDNQSDMEIDE